MFRFGLSIKIAILIVATTGLVQVASAQTELRRGVLLFNNLQGFAEEGSSTVSYGTLADLQSDSNFEGDFPFIYDVAEGILEGYTVVQRGGYFPENAGIPREQQLTRTDAVYYVFTLQNGYELVLYRTPGENTSRYFIRRPVGYDSSAGDTP
jgi:hypothetical protein